MTAPIRTMPERIRDWHRGWSQADLDSVLDKLAIAAPIPGGMIKVTDRELRAHVAYMRQFER